MWYLTLAIFVAYAGLWVYFAVGSHGNDKVLEAAGYNWAKSLFYIAVCWFAFGRKTKSEREESRPASESPPA